MSNERPIGTGLVTITSDYEYVLGYMTANVIKFQADFSDGGWTRQELDIISHELENTAKFFAEEQGLNSTISDLSINGTEVTISTGKSGELYRSIKSRIHGESVVLSANAKNSRGQFYAGHIEYGFHDRGGNFVQARPFLRPALYAVSESSKGRMAYTLRELLTLMFTEGGYNGYSNINSFGRLRTPSGGIRGFYKQPRYGPNSGLRVSSFYKNRYNLNSKQNNYRKQLRGGKLRDKFSVNRYDKTRDKDRDSFKTRTNRTRPLRQKTKKQIALTKRRQRKRSANERFNNYLGRKNALRKAKNLEPMSHKESKFLTDHEHMDYKRDLRKKREQEGTLRNYREEKDNVRKGAQQYTATAKMSDSEEKEIFQQAKSGYKGFLESLGKKHK